MFDCMWENKPRFFWLEFSFGNFPRYHDHFKESENDAYPGHIIVKYIPVTKTQLWAPLHICHLASSLNEGMGNRSIQSLVKERRARRLLFIWRGSVIAYATEQDSTTPRDIDMQDFRELVDFFNSYDCLCRLPRDWPKANFDMIKTVIQQLAIAGNALLCLGFALGFDVSLRLAMATVVLCGPYLLIDNEVPILGPVVAFFAGLLATYWAVDGKCGYLATFGLGVIVFALILLVAVVAEGCMFMYSKFWEDMREKRRLRLRSPGLVG
jgi:hypothetical protein